MVHIKKKSFKQRVYKSPCVCVCVCVCVLCALVAQSCLTLRNMPGLSVLHYLLESAQTVLQSVQWLSHVQLFATPWIAVCQASLSITNS